ncbi:glycosyltransferase [Rhodopseudomonas palustris]|uniref:glycosyltransferase n=1 Tax=Rhodopseudomonas palustris TaxID=1076 RepID=UPI0021F313C4|nr:glycosyltransferase [Rhodopseudomonas palustris]UYO53622.1 glycosyltransferase [Rhodopseudomonas palustris]
MSVHKMPSLQDVVRSSNPLIASKMAPRPDFLGELDESRLIGQFRDDLSGGDKLALLNFILRECELKQLEVLRGATEALFVVEQHECMHTQIDLLCLDVAVLQECASSVFARLLKLLSPKGIVCIESNDRDTRIDVDLIPGGAFESVMAAPGFSVFAQIKGERSPRSVRYQIDLYRRKRYFERKHRARLAAEPKIPDVAVFILTYKHEAFIAECLRSIMKQRGHFTMRVLIIDDASPDNTAQVARSVIAENRDDRIRFELRVNPHNVGASANWGPALKWAEGADYVAPVDGDDFWSSEYRIQEHIDFLRERPTAIMSFNSFEFCTADSSERRRGIHLDEEIIGADRFVRDNPVGNLGSTFYRGELVEIFPLEPFYYTNGDWKINVYCSQIGPSGYVDKALSVYRLHGGGVWSLKGGVERLLPTIDGILKFNAFTDFSYNRQYNWLFRESARALGRFIFGSVDDLGTFDLIILHDEFPRRGEFHYAEFTAYLREFPSSLLLATLDGYYQRRYPELGSRTIEDDGTFPLHLGKLIYLATLRITYSALPRIETAGVPFVFTLCPKGGFVLGNQDVDMQLKRIFGSPLFTGVIVTQHVIHDYIVGNALCPKEKVEFSYGGVMPDSSKESSTSKRRWGFGKSRLDICFVAHQSAPYGRDVGYDVFVEVAKALHERHDDICFHVAGALRPCAIDISSLGEAIKFYPSLTSDKFSRFFQDMDLILSPVVRGATPTGAINSVPTDYCVEAGARGVAIFTADEFHATKDHFTDGEDIVLMEAKAADIIGKIERYYAAPEMLKTIGEQGARAIRGLYSSQSQMAPRINLLREVIRNSKPAGETHGLRVKLAAMQAELELRDAQLAAVRRSRSWRISAPARFVGHLVRRDFVTAGNVIRFAIVSLKRKFGGLVSGRRI